MNKVIVYRFLALRRGRWKVKLLNKKLNVQECDATGDAMKYKCQAHKK
jgi:hypothetical protein